MLGRVFSRLGLCAALALSGCTSQRSLGNWDGPDQLAVATIKDWSFNEEKARILESDHYRIYTTIKEDDVAEMLPQVMEGAMKMYRQIAPDIPVSSRPLECYIFGWRSEFDEYTQRFTGKDYLVYGQIRSGGYTLYDRYVAYYIGRPGTFSVAAHEGWHQFAGRHFKGRMPPFLEEGLACMFETITWQGSLPRFNLSVNAMRAETLRKAVEAKDVIPLWELCSMHAGDIVGAKNEKIDAFYAQCWAFARFLWEGEHNRYRPVFQKWLAETADGTVYDPTGSHVRALAPWNRKAVGPMIEHYLGRSLAEIDQSYQAYMKTIAYEELPAHHRS